MKIFKNKVISTINHCLCSIFSLTTITNSKSNRVKWIFLMKVLKIV